MTSAADELDQSQSGLSKQLTLLERSIGQPLFNRTGRGLTLTYSGQKLYEALRPAFTDEAVLAGVVCQEPQRRYHDNHRRGQDES